LQLSGILHVYNEGTYNFYLGSINRSIILLDEKVLIENSGNTVFVIKQKSIKLKKGAYPIEISFVDSGNDSRLLVDICHENSDYDITDIKTNFEPAHLDSLFPDGLKGFYYEGLSPDGAGMKTGNEIKVKESLEAIWTDYPGLHLKTWPCFNLSFNGMMKINNSGVYRFVLGSDDGSRFYLDDNLVINNGGSHPYREEENILYLNAKSYNFRMEYFNSVADAALTLKVYRADLPNF
jgi:hypothetical protein